MYTEWLWINTTFAICTTNYQVLSDIFKIEISSLDFDNMKVPPKSR
jgi:hypothetical protein